MGNNNQSLQGFQGIQAPVPLDEFDQAPPTNSVCRAASSSAQAGEQQMTHCARGQTQEHLQNLFQVPTTFGDASRRSAGAQPISSVSAVDGPLPGAPGPEVIPIQGGGHNHLHTENKTIAGAQMQGTFAPTTECMLQNLTMAVGNPSARCYANAPWRAFTWTCALLQETNAQPWGNLQDAVQESLELAEAVDIHQLPGLQLLWKKRNLNIQGDANHFVNTLSPWSLGISLAALHRSRPSPSKAVGIKPFHGRPLNAPSWLPEST